MKTKASMGSMTENGFAEDGMTLCSLFRSESDEGNDKKSWSWSVQSVNRTDWMLRLMYFCSIIALKTRQFLPFLSRRLHISMVWQVIRTVEWISIFYTLFTWHNASQFDGGKKKRNRFAIVSSISILHFIFFGSVCHLQWQQANFFMPAMVSDSLTFSLALTSSRRAISISW